MTQFSRSTGLISAVVVALSLTTTVGAAASGAGAAPSVQHRATHFHPGAAGLGDPYFPHDGNGGYDVERYTLDLRYDPATDRLEGTAHIHARATQDLSTFNLDFDGLQVAGVVVDERPATWTRHAGELTVDPSGPGLPRGHRFEAEVRYAGVPTVLKSAALGQTGGFFATDDGALAVGQPHGASGWFPVNDYPTDKAAYTFRVTVPSDRQVVANGTLEGREQEGAWTTWTWRADDPMASYLATVDIGRFDLHSYTQDGISYLDAIDPDLFRPVASPRTGDRYALTGLADSSYKRLQRTIRVPKGGATLSFWTKYALDPGYDFLLVEAHPVGSRRWTTLPDANGHTSRSTGYSCPWWLRLHPFLKHYQRAKPDGSCAPRGSTGRWHAATRFSKGYQHWRVDLSRYAGRRVQVAISQVSDDVFQWYGAFVDDITVSTGAGTTSFEDDGNPMDGWAAAGPPKGSPKNKNSWVVGTPALAPPPQGTVAQQAFARQPEILRLLASRFGVPYPYRTAGGIVDDSRQLHFALETQTRPIYERLMFLNAKDAAGLLAHELAHQWYGDSVSVRRWRDIWLNEGFATYAEWLWSAHEHGPTPAQTFRDIYRNDPAPDPSWKVVIGNPGPKKLFSVPVYVRGAMTLQALRMTVGGKAFFTILRRWATDHAGGNVTTRQFIRLAERVSGRNLHALFHAWLYTPAKPRLPR